MPCDCMAKITEGYSDGNVELSKITGRFNGSIYGKSYVVANEALDSNFDKLSQLEQIKKLVERPSVQIEPKGVDVFTAENVSNIDITSNNSKPVLVSPTDRRFCVSMSANIHANDREYWKFYQEELINRQGFWDDLAIFIKEIPSDDFLSEPIPETNARYRLKLASLSPINRFLYTHLKEFNEEMVSRDWLINHWNDDHEAIGKYSRDGFVNAVIDSCEHVRITNGPNKGRFRYLINDTIFEKLQEMKEHLEQNDNGDEEEKVISKEDLDKDEEEIKEYVEGLVKEADEGFDYILSREIEKGKKATVEIYLQNNNWEFRTTLSHKFKIRGWKKNKPQTA